MARKMAAVHACAANPNTEQRVPPCSTWKKLPPLRDHQASGTAYPHTTARGTNRSLDGNAATYPNTAERNAGRPNQGPYQQDSPNQIPPRGATRTRAFAPMRPTIKTPTTRPTRAWRRDPVPPRYDDNAPGGRYPVRRAQAEGPRLKPSSFPDPWR